MNLSETQHQRAVFEQAAIGVIETDLDGRVTYANPHAMNLVGVPRFHGLQLRELFEDPAQLDEQLRNRRAGLIGNYRARLVRQSDQALMAVDVTAVPITDADGRISGSFALMRHPLEEEINRIHQEVDEPDSVLFRVMQELHKVLTYDLVTVTRYSSDLHHSQPFFVYRPGSGTVPGKVTWRKKQWDAIPAPLAAEVADTRTVCIDDLPARLSDPRLGPLRDTPLVQALLAEGVQCCVRRTVRRKGRLCASVTFYSRQRGGLAEDHRQRIDELPIAASVLQAIDHFDRRREAEQNRLLRDVAFCPSIEAVYQTLLRRLCEIFAWQRASVFRVDHARGRIKLVALFAAPHTTLTRGLTYEQGITDGVLGRVVRTRQAQVVPDVREDPDYLADAGGHGGPESALVVRSELCWPLGLEGEGKVRWIINVDDARVDAFSDEEVRWLGDTAHHVAGFMQRLSTLNFLSDCLDHTSEALVVVDAHGQIKRANPAAASLFGTGDEKALRGDVDRLFARPDEAARARAAPDGYLGEFDIQVAGDGPGLAAGVSRKPLPDDIGGAIYVFKDMRPIRRALELELLERAAYEVALETRTPLTVAVTDLERLVRGRDPLPPDGAERLLKYLYRAQHAYTKLALYNTEVRAAPSEPQLMDLGQELRALVRWLPEEMATLMQLHRPPEPVRCRGDCFELGFVFETVLVFFLRMAPEEVPLQVRVQRQGDEAQVVFEGLLSRQLSTSGPGSRDQHALSDLRLAAPLITHFVQRNGGRFQQQWLAGDVARHTLAFPAR